MDAKKAARAARFGTGNDSSSSSNNGNGKGKKGKKGKGGGGNSGMSEEQKAILAKRAERFGIKNKETLTAEQVRTIITVEPVSALLNCVWGNGCG
jgi:hypothetical protein